MPRGQMVHVLIPPRTMGLDARARGSGSGAGRKRPRSLEDQPEQAEAAIGAKGGGYEEMWDQLQGFPGIAIEYIEELQVVLERT